MESVLKEILEGINGITKRLDNIESEQIKTNDRLDNLETKLTQSSVMLEKVDGNVKLLAEGQEAFREQIGRSSKVGERTIFDRIEVVELAVTTTSKDVKYIKHKVQDTEEDVFAIQDHLKIIK